MFYGQDRMRGRIGYQKSFFLLLVVLIWILYPYYGKNIKIRAELREWTFQAAGYLSNYSSCPPVSPNLIGATNANFTASPMKEKEIEKENPLVLPGGLYYPRNCSSKYKFAVIIPFRKRDGHLLHFLHYMHPLFQRKQMIYKIFIVNQYMDGPFNRAKLMNVGFVEAVHQGYDCFLFHDVDMILENDDCPIQCNPAGPVHLGFFVDLFNYTAFAGNTHLGGVALFTKDQYYQINGMSNAFWGWGGEDDDLYRRTKLKGLQISRSDRCRYKMISHDQAEGNILRDRLLKRPKSNYLRDGITNLKYTVVRTDLNGLYTNITVSLLEPAYGIENFDQRFLFE